MDNILNRNIIKAQIAEILALIEGDGCQQNIVTKLCEHLELEAPEGCSCFDSENKENNKMG